MDMLTATSGSLMPFGRLMLRQIFCKMLAITFWRQPNPHGRAPMRAFCRPLSRQCNSSLRPQEPCRWQLLFVTVA